MDEIRDIARLYDIYTVLQLDPHQKVFLCPLPQHAHHNNTPSFSIRVFKDGRQRFRCFGNCGLGGDVIDLVGYMQIPGYNPKKPVMVFMAAARLQGKPISPPKIEQKKTALEPGLWRRYVPPGPEAVAYARLRGLNDATIEKFKLGQMKDALSIPAFENGILKMIKFRSMRPDARMRYWSEKGSVVALFNHDAVALTDDPVLVSKGEISTMVLDQYGFKACAPTTGEGRSDMLRWAQLLTFSKKVVVVTDNDAKPETHEKIWRAAKIRAAQLHADLRCPPEKYKDIDEAILAEPGPTLELIRSWLE